MIIRILQTGAYFASGLEMQNVDLVAIVVYTSACNTYLVLFELHEKEMGIRNWDTMYECTNRTIKSIQSYFIIQSKSIEQFFRIISLLFFLNLLYVAFSCFRRRMERSRFSHFKANRKTKTKNQLRQFSHLRLLL